MQAAPAPQVSTPPPAAPPNNNGGVFVGKSHDNGGIKFEVPQTGQKVEIEGGEFSMCDSAMSSTKVHTFKGTRLEIAKKINMEYGCSTGVVTGVQGGQFVLCNAATQNPEIVEVSGTPKEILNQLSTSVACKPAENAAPAANPMVAATGGAIPPFDWCPLSLLF